MVALTESTKSTLSPQLVALLEEHELEIVRLQAEFGDPAEALSQFVRDHFTSEAFLSLEEDDDELSGW